MEPKEPGDISSSFVLNGPVGSSPLVSPSVSSLSSSASTQGAHMSNSDGRPSSNPGFGMPLQAGMRPQVGQIPFNRPSGITPLAPQQPQSFRNPVLMNGPPVGIAAPAPTSLPRASPGLIPAPPAGSSQNPVSLSGVPAMPTPPASLQPFVRSPLGIGNVRMPSVSPGQPLRPLQPHHPGQLPSPAGVVPSGLQGFPRLSSFQGSPITSGGVRPVPSPSVSQPLKPPLPGMPVGASGSMPGALPPGPPLAGQGTYQLPVSQQGYPRPPIPNGVQYPGAMASVNGSPNVLLSNQSILNQSGMPPGQVQLGQPNANVHMKGPQGGIDGLNTQFGQMGVTSTGFNRLWGTESVDLLANRIVLPPEGVTAPPIRLNKEYLNRDNCSSEIIRCTLTKFPETQSLLEKSRLPLGLLLHPFKDLNQLPVVTCQNITRCRVCRTYINPFVYFVDGRRWKCNLCFRVNDLPDDFLVDPVSKQYGDPSKRPEVQNATIEYIAPAEYMLRAPPPATYIYLLEATMASIENGYLRLFCDIFLEELDRIPGDARAQFAFITFGSSVHFHVIEEGTRQPRMMVVNDINDIFLPTCDGLLAKRSSCADLISNLLEILPTIVEDEARGDVGGNCLGAALQAASKLAWTTGGRVSAFLSTLPTLGPGALKIRGDQTGKGSKEAGLLAPAVDFYKSMALENTGQHIAVDVFFLGSQYQDVASIACVSKYSSGCLYKFPGFHHVRNPLEVHKFESVFRRYLTRKIGFESVMRIRCTRGLSVHTFHGNLFVRSTDLVALANVNPDAGFGMQVSITEPLSDMTSVCFQAAVLYTSSKGERRIRVHTICLPIASNVSDIITGADQQCIIGLLSKIAVERSVTSSLSDAREAFVNAAADPLSSYKALQSIGGGQLLAPPSLNLLPMYILAMLKTVAFRDIPTDLDERVFDMCEMKSLPLHDLIQHIYPDLYAVHLMDDEDPPRLHLSSERVDTTGVYLMDAGRYIFILVGRTSPVEYCRAVFDVDDPRRVETSYELPLLDTPESKRLNSFVESLQSDKPCPAAIQIFRDDAREKANFFNRLVEDRSQLGIGYFEFLQQLKTRVK